jgi:hypothetical protein
MGVSGGDKQGRNARMGEGGWEGRNSYCKSRQAHAPSPDACTEPKSTTQKTADGRRQIADCKRQQPDTRQKMCSTERNSGPGLDTGVKLLYMQVKVLFMGPASTYRVRQIQQKRHDDKKSCWRRRKRGRPETLHEMSLFSSYHRLLHPIHRIAFPLSKLKCELYALEGELGPHSTQKASKLKIRNTPKHLKAEARSHFRAYTSLDS